MSTAFIEIDEIDEIVKPAEPPEYGLLQLIFGGVVAQTVYAAAKLGTADHLISGPKSVEELAISSNTDANSLYRVLRALASLGVFVEHENRIFGLTPVGEKLRSGSLRDAAIFMGEGWHLDVWAGIVDSVRTGESQWSKVHGLEAFDYLARNPEASQVFDQAMTSLASLSVEVVIRAYDFTGVETLVDVAGGHGRLLTSIMRTQPMIRGVLFDLPHVIEGAKERLNVGEFGDRLEFVSGDFFQSVPRGADVYIVKHIIHDWDDERALTILKNIRQAMKPNGKVVLMEAVLGEPNVADLSKLMDIAMLVVAGGKERTINEYRELLSRAGLRLSQTIPTKSAYTLLEAVIE